MKRPYCCEASRHLFNQYYAAQQKGGGDFPVYVGRMRQRGHGIGDIFRSIWRFISPAFKTLAPHALRAGANIVEDVSSGNTWKDSAFKHVPTVVRQFPEAISNVVSARSKPKVISTDVSDNNEQTGSGIQRRRKHKRRAKKRAKIDIFS
jgi:hypothetical protein